MEMRKKGRGEWCMRGQARNEEEWKKRNATWKKIMRAKRPFDEPRNKCVIPL